jgi:hypothetical protein
MNDLWGWLWRSVYEDESRREWYADWRRAMDIDESDPAAAITILDAAIARAANANDLWWKLFLEHWKLQMLLNKKRDFSAALDCAARATLEVRGSQFDAFPQRICLHEDLISSYGGLDPQGYAPLIQNALNYMESQIAPGMECEMCHIALRAEFYRSTGHPEALDLAWEYLERAERKNHEFYGAQACLQLCHSLAEIEGVGAREQMTEILALGRDLLVRAKYTEGTHEILMWSALVARWNGEPEAPRAYQRAREARARYGAAARPGYYYAGVLFHEADGNLERAIQLLDEELQEIEGGSEFWREANRRLKKCELLKEMGLSWHTEGERVRQVAQKLNKPEGIAAKLAALGAPM